MKSLAYKLLTQAIIILGNIRESLLAEWASRTWSKDWEVRKDRTFYASNNSAFSCCDCGLIHATTPLDRSPVIDQAFKFIPIRPKGYDYSFRRFAGTPSDFVDESKE